MRAFAPSAASQRLPVVSDHSNILTDIPRVNYGHLDRVQQVVAGLNVRYWGVSNGRGRRTLLNGSAAKDFDCLLADDRGGEER